jgi:hypothetical protein
MYKELSNSIRNNPIKNCTKPSISDSQLESKLLWRLRIVIPGQSREKC